MFKKCSKSYCKSEYEVILYRCKQQRDAAIINAITEVDKKEIHALPVAKYNIAISIKSGKAFSATVLKLPINISARDVSLGTTVSISIIIDNITADAINKTAVSEYFIKFFTLNFFIR